jgi:hypothetical protein
VVGIMVGVTGAGSKSRAQETRVRSKKMRRQKVLFITGSRTSLTC